MACRVGPAGVEEQGVGTGGFPRNLGEPERLPAHHFPAMGTGDEPQARGGAFWTVGSETTDATQGIAKRRQPSAARGTQEVGALHSTCELGELDPWEPGGGKGEPGHATVGGKHDGCTETRGRVNATTTDSRASEAIPGNGIHFPGTPHGHGLDVRGLCAYPQGRRRRRGRTDGRGLCWRRPTAEAGRPSRPGQVRHVPSATRAAGAHTERNGPRDPPDRYPDF